MATNSNIHYNKIAHRYEDNRFKNNYGKLYAEMTWNNIIRFLPKNKSLILDAGGGTGFFSRKFAKLGHRVVMTDISNNMIKIAKTLTSKDGLKNIEFVLSDVSNMKEFKDNIFDFVIANKNVVSYCQHPKKAVKELCRVAKRGAFVYVEVNGFFRELDILIRSRRYEKAKRLLKTHRVNIHGFNEYCFTIYELENLFTKVGLRVADVSSRSLLISGFISKERDEILSNPKAYRIIKKIELDFSRKPYFIGTGSIRMVGKKV
jgi:ubiquinone/menaquinone biosynthesis C-methylase UbiE